MIEFKTPSEVRAQWRGQASFIVDGIVHSSVNMILGDPEAGKTFLAVSLAKALAADDTWLGRKVMGGPHRTAYVTMDAGDHEATADRYAALGGPEQGLLLGELADEFPDWSATFSALRAQGVSVVVLDNVTALMGGRDINSSAETTAVLGPIKHAARATRLTVVLVAHTNKGAGGSGSSHLGSQAIRALTRNTLTLTGKGGQRRLTVEGNYAPREVLNLSFRVEGHAGLFTPTESQQSGNETARQRGRSRFDYAGLADYVLGSEAKQLQSRAAVAAWLVRNAPAGLEPASLDSWKTRLSRCGLAWSAEGCRRSA